MLAKRERNRNVLAVISIIFSALLIGAGMAFDFSPFLPNIEITLRTVSLFGVLVFMATIIWYIYSQTEIINAITPNIVFDSLRFQDDIFPFMANDPFLGDAGSGISIGAKVLRLDIYNRPKNPSVDNVAKMVSATVRYYDSSGKLLGTESKGRWATKEYPKSTRQIPNVLSTDIESNGNVPAVLDLALMTALENNKDDVYIFNNETLFLKAEKRSGKDFFLGKNIVFANIKLKGARIDDEKWIEFNFMDKTCGILKEKPKFSN